MINAPTIEHACSNVARPILSCMWKAPRTIRYSTENALANRNLRSRSFCFRWSGVGDGISRTGSEAVLTDAR